MNKEAEPSIDQELHIRSAARLFIAVSKKFPVHTIIQGVALAQTSYDEAIKLEVLENYLLHEKAILLIKKAAHAQPKHIVLSTADIVHVIKWDMGWAYYARLLSVKQREEIMTYGWQEFCLIRERLSSTAVQPHDSDTSLAHLAVLESASLLISRYWPYVT